MTLDGVRFKKVEVPAGEKPRVVIEGKAAPNAEVVVENQSVGVFAPGITPDRYVRAKAGADGSFSVEVPAPREGDHVGVKSGGKAYATRLKEIEAIDGRPPVVRQQGLRLLPDGDGFTFTHVCKSDVVGEPHQTFTLTHTTTGEVTSLTLDNDGRLPKDARVKGALGDLWNVSTSDGAHNVTSGCGVLLAPPADPTAEPRATTMHPNAQLGELKGPLFVGGPDARTVIQGEIGDCWLVSACDAICKTNPGKLREIIKDNGNGTYTVTFQRFDHEKQRYVKDEVTVTNQVYLRGGKPLYGSSSTGDVWFAILEKAYAQWKGGYDGCRSGYPFEAFEALLGNAGRHFDCDATGTEALWRQLQKRASTNAMVTWTRVDTAEVPFVNTGLAGDHAYSVLGVSDVNGERMVKVRNPWGSNGWVARNNRVGIKADNDVLEVPLAVFARFFAGVGCAPCAAAAVA